jgi:hypothetical protein
MLDTVLPVLELHPQSPAAPKLKSDKALPLLNPVMMPTDNKQEIRVKHDHIVIFLENIMQLSEFNCL